MEQVVVPAKRADLDTPEDAFLITSAGRFVRRKGFDSLIRAVAEVPDAWLWLVGDGRRKSRTCETGQQDWNSRKNAFSLVGIEPL